VLSHGSQPPSAGSLQRLAGRSGWEDSPFLRSIRAAGSAINGTIRAAAAGLEVTGRGRR
jgi:hypothetical protein